MQYAITIRDQAEALLVPWPQPSVNFKTEGPRAVLTAISRRGYRDSDQGRRAWSRKPLVQE